MLGFQPCLPFEERGIGLTETEVRARERMPFSPEIEDTGYLA